MTRNVTPAMQIPEENMNRFRYIALLALAATALGMQSPASAYCADSAGAIKFYFDTANGGPEGTTQEIRVVRGTYNVDKSLLFAPDDDKDSKTFKLSGGWSAGCADGTQQIDPDNTVIHMSAASS